METQTLNNERVWLTISQYSEEYWPIPAYCMTHNETHWDDFPFSLSSQLKLLLDEKEKKIWGCIHATNQSKDSSAAAATTATSRHAWVGFVYCWLTAQRLQVLAHTHTHTLCLHAACRFEADGWWREKHAALHAEEREDTHVECNLHLVLIYSLH